MEKQKVLSFYKGNADAAVCYDALEKALKDAGIFTDLTMLGAMATVRVEVGRNFKPITEYTSGAVYEGRKDLGNTQKGDGIKYKGRGYIQLTGRTNYTNFGKRIGVDLVNKPELALDIKNSAKILAYYFKDKKCNVACNAKDWKKVRKLVNGGTNGLDEFLRVIKDYLAVTNL